MSESTNTSLDMAASQQGRSQSGPRHGQNNIDLEESQVAVNPDTPTASKEDHEKIKLKDRDADERNLNVDLDEDEGDDEFDEENAQFTHYMSLQTLNDFLIVVFSLETAMTQVYSTLKTIWHTSPPEGDSSTRAVEQAMRALATVQDSRASSPRENPDDWESEWRRSIYYQFNHIFYDTARNLLPRAPVFGHFHPPNQTAFALEWPLDAPDQATGSVIRNFETPVLLIPAFVDQNCRVEMELSSENGTPLYTSTSDAKNGQQCFRDSSLPNQIIFVSAGRSVKFYVRQTTNAVDRDATRVAAVFVCGHLCQKDDRDAQQMESEEDRRHRAEARSAYNTAILLFQQNRMQESRARVQSGIAQQVANEK